MFDNLPVDMHSEILKYVKTRQLGALAKSNRFFNYVSHKHVQTRDIRKRRIPVTMRHFDKEQWNRICVFVDDDMTDLYQNFLFERVYSHLSFDLGSSCFDFKPHNLNRSKDFIQEFSHVSLSELKSITVVIVKSVYFTFQESDLGEYYIDKFCTYCGKFSTTDNQLIFYTCSECKHAFCYSCADVVMCSKCSRLFCNDCNSDLTWCDGCDNHFCSSCYVSMKSCFDIWCQRTYCSECTIAVNLIKCSYCSTPFCERHLAECNHCFALMCSVCLKNDSCSLCGYIPGMDN